MRSSDERPPAGGREGASLAQSIVALAGTPADAGDIDEQLATVARLAADTLIAVSYASVTAIREDASTTVAASSELAAAVDGAPDADLSGSSLDGLRRGVPVAAPDTTATMRWPGFREAAAGMGMRAALSVPLFDGSGEPVAVLSLFGHDPAAMDLLHWHVEAAHNIEHRVAAVGRCPPPLGPDGDEFIAGLTGALTVLSTIQQGIGIVMAGERCSAEAAYRILRGRAAATGRRLVDVAATARDLHPVNTDRERDA